jgi:hypothetical protein
MKCWKGNANKEGYESTTGNDNQGYFEAKSSCAKEQERQLKRKIGETWWHSDCLAFVLNAWISVGDWETKRKTGHSRLNQLLMQTLG